MFLISLNKNVIVLISILFLKWTFAQKIPLAIFDRLKEREKIDVIVSFKGGIDSVLITNRGVPKKNYGYDPSVSELEKLRKSLIENMKSSQEDVISTLMKRKSNDTKFTNFWITNQLLIQNADLETILEISRHPKVSNIKEEGVVFLLAPELNKKTNEDMLYKPVGTTWGVDKIHAPETWNQLGLNGSGVIVATIDTGVRHTHEALSENFLGEYGWFDPSHSQDGPFDVLGHGTHVLGTMVGKGGIGVAPGASWATCAMCSNKLQCLPRYTLECGQFFVCPTLFDGSKPDCSKRPRVISNAWGSFDVEAWTDMIRVWHAAGIIPVFALGNSGPNCSSTYFPGNHTDVIAVGNTDSDDVLHETSSVGPTTDGRIKPDIVAPGTNILSSSGANDQRYRIATGTSMSAPHVAGAIALLLGKQKDLSFQQVKTILFEGAQKKGLVVSGIRECDLNKTHPVKFPNNLFGYGRLDIFNSVSKV